MRLPGLLIVSLFLVQMACNKERKTDIIENEAYGADARNRMDVFLPEQRSPNTEAVILIHGGGWVAGDKSDFSNSDFRKRLVKNGFAAVSINYRYACGDFHKQMEDISMVIRHIRQKAEEWNISDSSFALLGGSAGGHLSLLFAHAFDTAGSVKTVVSIVGPTDLTDTLFHQYATNYNIAYVFEQLLGSSIEDNPQVYFDASPVFNYSNVPSFFIYGKLDDLVPYQQGVRMYDSLVASGVIADTTIIQSAGHNVFGVDNIYSEQVLNEVTNWMLLHLDNE